MKRINPVKIAKCKKAKFFSSIINFKFILLKSASLAQIGGKSKT